MQKSTFTFLKRKSAKLLKGLVKSLSRSWRNILTPNCLVIRILKDLLPSRSLKAFSNTIEEACCFCERSSNWNTSKIPQQMKYSKAMTKILTGKVKKYQRLNSGHRKMKQRTQISFSLVFYSSHSAHCFHLNVNDQKTSHFYRRCF